MITAPVETETAAPPGAPATSDAWRVDESVMLTSAQALRRNLNLVRELAVTQFKLKYTGSVLGYLWSLIKPLMVFGMLYTVFELVLHAGRGTANFPMQLLVGIVLYTFFAETTGVAVNTVVTNGGIIKRAFFPRVILIIAATLTAFMTFTINMTLIIVVGSLMGKLSLGAQSLAILPLIIELYMLTLGIGLALSALFVFYRDLGHIWEILSQLLLYASAIVFPLTILHDARKLQVAAMNPLAQIVEDARHALVTQDPTVPWSAHFLEGAWVVPFAITAIILATGAAIFRHLTPRFAEYL